MNMDAKVLGEMFERAQERRGEDMKFSTEEADRFKKAFEDPEFRKMFADYMDEIQDPSYREETEQYISQLETEDKVPQGKQLIRYEPHILIIFSFLTIIGVWQAISRIRGEDIQVDGWQGGRKR
jgi:dynein assembly factor 2